MLRKFIRYYRPYRVLLTIDMAAALLRAGLTIVIPYLTARLLDEAFLSGPMDRIVGTITTLVALTLGVTACVYVNTRWGHILGARMETDMRQDLFTHLQKLSFRYFDRTKTGHIMSRISNDLFTIAEVAHHAPEDLFVSACLLIGSLFVMFRMHVTLTLWTLAPIVPMVLWGAFFRQRMRAGFRRVRKRIADINSQVENSIQGIREVKSYANENYEIERFFGVNEEFRFAKESMYGVMALFHSGMRLMMDACFVTVLCVGAILLRSRDLSFPVLIGFIMYVRFLIRPVDRLVGFVEQFQQGAASFERFVEIMRIEPDIVDRPGAIDPGPLRGAIELQNVSFRYAGSSEWALRNVSLSIPPGATVALVGESGAGKSTLAALIPRFYEPQEGTIRIDGHDIMDLSQSALRRNIGLVQQNVFLFDTTLRDNILFGNPDADESALVQATRDANIFKLIEALPDGCDSRVGEHGVKLSGGEKQRVSIARCFLKKPSILVFDEATSSLDTESEMLVQRSMERLRQGATTLVIAHRLSTVKNADYTVVMRSGRIVEEGTHEALIARKGYYWELYTDSLF